MTTTQTLPKDFPIRIRMAQSKWVSFDGFTPRLFEAGMEYVVDEREFYKLILAKGSHYGIADPLPLEVLVEKHKADVVRLELNKANIRLNDKHYRRGAISWRNSAHMTQMFSV